jgi:hypothetical protein
MPWCFYHSVIGGHDAADLLEKRIKKLKERRELELRQKMRRTSAWQYLFIYFISFANCRLIPDENCSRSHAGSNTHGCYQNLSQGQKIAGGRRTNDYTDLAIPSMQLV